MFKYAVRSYFTTLHPKNLGALQGSPGYFFYSLFYTGLLLSFISDIKEYNLIYKTIPFFIMGWSNRSSRYLLGKNMFLIPMKKEQRKEYINYVLGIKIGFPLLVGILVESIWSFIEGFQLARFLLAIFVYVSVGIALHIHLDGINKETGEITYAQRDRNENWQWAWMHMVSAICGVLLIQVYGFAEIEGTFSVLTKIAIGVGVAWLLFFDVYVLCTQYHEMMEYAADYEKAFHIPGSVKHKV